MSQGPPWFSPDGRWQWDGEHWIPVSGLPVPEPDPEPLPEPEPAPGPWYRTVPGFRSGSRGKAALALLAYLVVAVWILQTPWHPQVGLLGLLSLAALMLGTNAWGLRSRTPLLRSRNQAVAAAGWAGIAALLVFMAFLASRPSPASEPTAGQSMVNTPDRPASPVPTPTLGLTSPPAPPPTAGADAPVPVGAMTATPTPTACPPNLHGAHARHLCGPSPSPSPTGPQGG